MTLFFSKHEKKTDSQTLRQLQKQAMFLITPCFAFQNTAVGFKVIY